MREVNASGKKPFSTDEEDDAHASAAATTSTRKSTRSRRSHKEGPTTSTEAFIIYLF
jgi:hypothetical protein